MTILQNLLRQNRGNIPVIVYDEETKKQMAFKEEYFVKMTPELVNLLEKQFDSQNIIIK